MCVCNDFTQKFFLRCRGSVRVSPVVYDKDVVQVVGEEQISEGPEPEKCFSTLQNLGFMYKVIIGKQLLQSPVALSVTLLAHFRLKFLKTACVPESLHACAEFLVIIVQKQFQCCDSYTLLARKAVKIKQSFLSRIFH